MTINVHGYATKSPTDTLKPVNFERRDPMSDDVVIKILHCGVCHSDIHTARNEWGATHYPCVPGHEIIGLVEWLGNEVQGGRTCGCRLFGR